MAREERMGVHPDPEVGWWGGWRWGPALLSGSQLAAAA